MATPFHHPGSLMTLDEWIALPENEETRRHELQEGILQVTAQPTRKHQLAALRLAKQLDAQLTLDWDLVPEMEVVLRADFPPTVRVPDMVVTRVDGPDQRLAASDVLLAVEIISPGSRKVDTHLKSFEYADAGIANYWLVDLDPPAPSITVFHLGAPGDGYIEAPAVAGMLDTTAPFELHIDIESLVTPRGAR